MFNIGLFYIRSSVPSVQMLDRITTRPSKEKARDQAIYNEELFIPSHPGNEGLHALSANPIIQQSCGNDLYTSLDLLLSCLELSQPTTS